MIATSPQIFCGYAGVWYKRLRRVPLVIEIRDIWPESMGAVGAKIPSFAYWVLEKIEKAMYRTCNRLVTVGEGYEARLIEKGIPKDKISIVMNGTDLAVYKPQPKNEALLEKYGLKDRFVVSYIGTVGMACGLEVVLEAAEVLDGLTGLTELRGKRKIILKILLILSEKKLSLLLWGMGRIGRSWRRKRKRGDWRMSCLPAGSRRVPYQTG